MQLSALKVCAGQLESKACLFWSVPQGILDDCLFGEQAKNSSSSSYSCLLGFLSASTAVIGRVTTRYLFCPWRFGVPGGRSSEAVRGRAGVGATANSPHPPPHPHPRSVPTRHCVWRGASVPHHISGRHLTPTAHSVTVTRKPDTRGHNLGHMTPPPPPISNKYMGTGLQPCAFFHYYSAIYYLSSYCLLF